jgi:hypothetical protein
MLNAVAGIELRFTETEQRVLWKGVPHWEQIAPLITVALPDGTHSTISPEWLATAFRCGSGTQWRASNMQIVAPPLRRNGRSSRRTETSSNNRFTT